MDKKEIGVLGAFAAAMVGTAVYQVCKIKREQEELEIDRQVQMDTLNLANEAMREEHEEKMKNIREQMKKDKEELDKEFETIRSDVMKADREIVQLDK